MSRLAEAAAAPSLAVTAPRPASTCRTRGALAMASERESSSVCAWAGAARRKPFEWPPVVARAAVALLAVLTGGSARAQVVRQDFYVTNGPVHATALLGN